MLWEQAILWARAFSRSVESCLDGRNRGGTPRSEHGSRGHDAARLGSPTDASVIAENALEYALVAAAIPKSVTGDGDELPIITRGMEGQFQDPKGRVVSHLAVCPNCAKSV